MENSFLRQTAESILSQIDWKQLNRTTLVLPSHRAGLVLKDELLRLQQERHAQAVWAPQVRTLNQLQDELSPLYAEDELFTIVRLYRIYSHQPMPLDLFYGWGRQMIADFTNVDASMPAEEVPNFFDNTIAAHELEQWQLDPETEERLRGLMANGEGRMANGNSVKAQYEQLWQHLYELYQALKAEMYAEQKGYPGMRQRAVLEHWEEESLQTKIAGRTYIFVGFNYLLPVERDLMLRLRDAGQAMFFWDFVPDFRTNEKAFSFTRQNKDILGGTNLQSPVTRNPSPVTLIECTSREAQAQYVHRWLSENYTAKGQKVGVVICDETMLEPVIYTIPAITVDGELTPVNITKGFPLRNTAIYARVLAWLSEQTRGRADEPAEPEIMDALLAALVPEPTEQTESTNDSMTWKELLIMESEYQVRKIANQIRKLLSEGIEGVPFTRKLLRLLFRRTMESVTMPFHGEPVTDVQVMGVLETRLLDFDKLLILNVEEGVIPQRQNDLSFIPFYLRKAYHMQTPDERATVYAYNFFRLLSRTGEATIMYATAETAEGGKGMSRFIMQMIYSPEFTVQKQVLQERAELSGFTIRPSEQGRTLLSMLTKDENGALRRADGRRYLLSPSALNTYISCPRCFYFQYIQGIRPKDEPEVLFGPATIGSFVHHMMEYIYRTYLHCDNQSPVRIEPETIEAIRTDEQKMEEALAVAYEKMRTEEEKDFKPEEHASENVVIKRYVSNILERDREDAKNGLQMFLLEQDRLFAVPIEGVGEVLTGGRIDRLDIVGSAGNEHLRVVDYKSGSYSDTTHAKKMSATWEELMESEDKGYVRQTLIYSEAVRQHDPTQMPIEPHLFFCKRKLTDIVTTIDVENETVHDIRTLHEPFMQSLQSKIAQILITSDFPPCEEDKCPNFCPFFALCGRKPKEF